MIYLLPQAVDAAAQRAPEHEAMCFLKRSLSYGELARASNSLARTLIDQGVRRQDRVGIFMDKCLETPIALHGIMKSGAAYVPLDPAAPAERLAYVLRHCGIRHVVTGDNKLDSLGAAAAKGAELDCLIGPDAGVETLGRSLSWEQALDAPGGSAPDVKIIESDLAYIIYTSGSTGEPKGIMHTHHSGLSFARWAEDIYGLMADDRLSNHAPLHFDLSILDYFAGAVAGATTVIIPESYTKLAASYSQLIESQRITVFYTVPYALIQLLLRGLLPERDFGALRLVIFGGEPFPTKHLRALMAMLPHVRFDNLYGPAEVNGCTNYTVTPIGESDEPIPIGTMAATAEALVVSDGDDEVAPGEIGELLVRSPTMMQGYWSRPDLNRDAFYRRPVSADYDRVYYRTGDLVREGLDGTLRFLGRKDRQIKVRGYRVELDEVEAVLAANQDIEEAGAFAVPDGDGSQEIRCAVTLKQGAEATSAALLSYLGELLPWYALPSELSIRAQLPRTTTGKISRRELQAEALRASTNLVQEHDA